MKRSYRKEEPLGCIPIIITMALLLIIVFCMKQCSEKPEGDFLRGEQIENLQERKNTCS